MFHCDTLRLIKRSFNRFFSLVMITAIGVAFMMGLFSSREIMEKSVDLYDDNMKLQDLQLYSSYGFDDSDVAALRRQDFTETILSSKMVDVFCRNSSDVETVMRIEEAERIMNMFELVEGRMPVRDDEIVIINNPSLTEGYRIGDRLVMSLDDEDISEWLENDTYTITGMVKAPSYMAVMLGTSNLKNKELQTVGYVKKSNFKQEYYTTLYLTVKGASAFNRYSGEYKEFMDNTKADVEVFARHQQDNLKEKLLEEYRQEIEDGQKELEEKKAEGQKKLDDAKSQLDEARIQIIAGETQLTSMKSIVEQTTIEIRTLERQYSATGDTAARIREIERNDPQHRNFTAIMTQLAQDYATYNALKSMQDGQPYQQQINEARQENQILQQQLDEVLYPERERLNAIISSGTASEEEKAAAASQLETVNSQIAENEGRIRANEVLIENLENMSGSSTSAAMQQLDDRYGGSITDTYASYSALYEDYLRMEAMQEEIRIANEALDRLNTEIRKAQADIASGKVEYEKGLKEYNDGLITFNEEIEKAEADIRKALQDLEELPEAEWMILDQDSHYSTYMYASNTTQMGAIGTVMPILFYLVAALVCMTTMTRLVDEQRGQIGIFRALGFSNAQITSKFVIYVLLATLAGSLIGLISGMAIFPVVIYKTWRLMYDLPDQLYLFPIKNVIICLLAFSALMVAVTCVVTNGSLKEMPSQLMRPKAPKMARKTFVEHIKFIWERLSFTSKITVRNLFRYRARFLMTVIGVAGCTGLLVLGFGIRDSISEVLEIQFNELLKYSSTVYLENDHELSEIVSALESDLDNEYVTPVMSYGSKVYLEKDEKVLTVQVMNARKGNEVLSLRSTDTVTPLKINNTGVIISQKFANMYGIHEGDYITIESNTGLKGQVKVNHICEWYFQHYIYMSADYYELVFDEPVHSNMLAIRTLNETQLQKQAEKFETVVSVTNFDAMIEQFNTMLRALNYIILVIIITAGSLAFVVLINLTQVNISERIREIATLKVLGFRAVEVDSYLFKEIMLLSVIGGFVGLPLGVLEHHFVMGIIDMEMIRFGTEIKLPSFIYAYVITIVFTVIVLLFTRRPLRKVEMIESLKSVE